MYQLQAGFARVDITPEEYGPMGGSGNDANRICTRIDCCYHALKGSRRCENLNISLSHLFLHLLSTLLCLKQRTSTES